MPRAPEDILVQEFRDALASGVYQLVRIRVLLNDLCDFILDPGRAASLANWLPQLVALSIFPVRTPQGAIQMSKITDNFFIPDESRELANLFLDSCSLLQISDELPLLRLKPLLESTVFAGHVKRLENYVQVELTPFGPPLQQSRPSRDFTIRLRYIRR